MEKKAKRNNENVFATVDEPDQKKAKTDGDTSVSANDLTYGVVTHITSASPVTDFMTLLRGEEPNFTLICGQMDSVIRQLVEGLGGTAAADAVIVEKIKNCLKAYRQEAAAIDPTTYNTFMHALKDIVSVRTLSDLWTRIKEDNLGLISESENSRGVEGSKASSFLELVAEAPAAAQPQDLGPDDDMEDLLDDL